MNKDDTEILIYIEDWKGRIRLEGGSGMEKMISSIAIRAALTRISTLPKSNIFIQDEGFGSLDAHNSATVGKLFENLKQLFDTIIIISHEDYVADMCDKIIMVEQDKNGFSYLKV